MTFKALGTSVILGTALMMGGCISSVLPDQQDAKKVYRLTTLSTSVTPSASAHIIRIDRPAASKHLSRTSIVVSPDGRRLAVASGGEWAQPIPNLVQSAFLDVISSRADLIGILPTSGARTTERVHLTIRNFEAQFDQGSERAPMAVVHYAVTLSDAGNRNLIGKYDVRKTVRANDIRVSSIVDAQDSANMAALTDIADWLASTLSAHKGAS